MRIIITKCAPFLQREICDVISASPKKSAQHVIFKAIINCSLETVDIDLLIYKGECSQHSDYFLFTVLLKNIVRARISGGHLDKCIELSVFHSNFSSYVCDNTTLCYLINDIFNMEFY